MKGSGIKKAALWVLAAIMAVTSACGSAPAVQRTPTVEPSPSLTAMSPTATQEPAATPPTATPQKPTASPTLVPPTPTESPPSPLQLSSGALLVVNAEPAIFEPDELANPRYVRSLNVAVEAGGGLKGAAPLLYDAAAEKMLTFKEFAFGPDNRLIVDAKTGVDMEALLATRVKSVVSGPVLDAKRQPGLWTKAVPGGYNNNVAYQVTTNPAEARAFWQDLLFPVSWWILNAPTKGRAYYGMTMADADGGVDMLKIQPAYRTQMYQNFMSMAQDSTRVGKYSSIMTDGTTFREMLECVRGSNACFDNPARHNVWLHSLHQEGSELMVLPASSSWVRTFADKLGDASSYDKLVAVVLSAAKSDSQQEASLSDWARATYGPDNTKVNILGVGFYRALATHAIASELGLPAGGIATLTFEVVDPAKADGLPRGTFYGPVELAPDLSPAFRKTLNQPAIDVTGIPIQTAFEGPTLWMPVSMAYLQQNGVSLRSTEITGNTRVPDTSFYGIRLVRTYRAGEE